MKAFRNNKKSVTWRSIEQTGFRPSGSRLGKQRQWLKFNRVTFMAGVYLLIFGISTSIYFLYDSIRDEKKFIKNVDKIELKFETTGFLSKEFLADFLGLRADLSFSDVDIFLLKDRIEELAQVKKAAVEKVFPRTLLVSVDEYQPVARVGVSEGGVKQVMFVSPEGEIFPSVNNVDELPYTLPFLSGVKIQKEEGVYLPIEGFSPLVELLEKARRDKGHLYNQWSIVSLGDTRFSGPDSFRTLVVHSKNLGMIIFSSQNISSQLEKLDYIVQDVEKRGVGGVNKIDLSMGDQVSVQAAQYNGKRLYKN